MGNCLITQLKEVVDNNNLSKLGELRIKNTGNAPLSITLGYGGIEKTLTVINGHFTDSTGQQNLGTTSVIEAGNQYQSKMVYFTPNAILCIPDKYKLTYFLFNNTVDEKYCEFDTSGFSFCTAIKYINLSGLYKELDLAALKNMTSIASLTIKAGNVRGDIANLANFDKVAGNVIIAYNRNINGNVASFAKWKSVNSLDITGTLINGSINDLGEAMFNEGNGRVSGTLVFECGRYGSNQPTITYTDTQTQETKLINACTLTFSTGGVTYTPTYRS